MKLIKLSTLTILLTSTLAFAGGDIAPVEPMIETPAVTVAPTTGNLYLGLAYSCLHLTTDTPDTQTTAWTGGSLSLGYNVNSYLAVEGRYTQSIGDLTYETWNTDTDKAWDMSNVAIYLKPKYNIDVLGLYGLIGYGQTTFDNGNSYSVSGLQYGAGFSVEAMDNVDVFIDYRRLYDDVDFDGLAPQQDVAANSWSVGVNYNF